MVKGECVHIQEAICLKVNVYTFREIMQPNAIHNSHHGGLFTFSPHYIIR